MNRINVYRPRLECLEDRLTPAIRLDLVTLHELGHALGLAHTNNVGSIMDPYYNANYNLNNFSNDPAVATFRSLFSNVNTSSWKNGLDPNPGDNKVTVTYSFMPDGSKAENNKNNEIFSRFNAIFGNASTWQNIIIGELNRWASVSNNRVDFQQVSDNGAKFGSSGAAQNDSHFGDIRIAAHRFDGGGKVLAHTYYPPPNGGTAAGDMHFDFAENWTDSGNGPLSLIPDSGKSRILFDEIGTGLYHHHDDEVDTSVGAVSQSLLADTASRVADWLFAETVTAAQTSLNGTTLAAATNTSGNENSPVPAAVSVASVVTRARQASVISQLISGLLLTDILSN